jgi:hypothetical protein
MEQKALNIMTFSKTTFNISTQSKATFITMALIEMIHNIMTLSKMAIIKMMHNIMTLSKMMHDIMALSKMTFIKMIHDIMTLSIKCIMIALNLMALSILGLFRTLGFTFCLWSTSI